MTRKSADYWQGYSEQAARSALDSHPNLSDLAHEVGNHLARDGVRKQRIVQRSPHIFGAMDGEELAQASSRELAKRELDELGIEPGDGDPVQVLDAHHGGRKMRA